MADQENTPATPTSLAEDTRTRKTVRLRTLVSAASGPSLADVPVVDGDEDTRTRLTVRLNPAKKAPAAPAVEEDDTRTRLTVKLNPANSAAEKPAVEAPQAPAAPAALQEEDTRTRMTVKLKPAAHPMPSISGEAKPAAPAAEIAEDDTRTRRNTVINPAAGADNDDRTVKIKRPAIKKPALTKAPVLSAPQAAAPESAPQAAAPESAPQAAAPESAPQAAAPQSAPAAPVLKLAADKSAAPKLTPVSEERVDAAAPADADNGEKGIGRTILLAAAMILLLAVALMATSQFLTFDCGIDFEVPGLTALNK